MPVPVPGDPGSRPAKVGFGARGALLEPVPLFAGDEFGTAVSEGLILLG
ncbi:hypothetical protein [Streptomyces fagopyri]